MNQRILFGAAGAMALGLALLPGVASAQQKSLKAQLVGMWTLVSFKNTAPDGAERDLFGANPKGILILDASGRYAQVQVRADRPKFAANNRLKGTPEENKAALAGTYASFGTWSVNDADKTFVRHIEGSASFPNEEGRDAKWSISLAGNELKVEIPAPGAGGRTDLVWKRIEGGRVSGYNEYQPVGPGPG